MKAAQLENYGGVENIVINEVDEPEAGEGQVLVENFASSINPFDWKLREGVAKSYINLEFPATLGGDFSGKIVGVGVKAADFKVGDNVYGQAAVYGGGTGAFAESLAASVDKISKKPVNTDFLEAAALPMVGVSAIQALETHIKLRQGQKILIHGGAGGIGHVAIQVAKNIGAYIATTVSGDAFDFVKELGANEAIDYKEENFEEKLKDFDAVLDAVGEGTMEKSFKVLKQGGIYVSLRTVDGEELAKKYGVQLVAQNSNVNRERLERIAALVDSQKVKVYIDRIFEIDQIREAFQYTEGGHPRGKVVLKIK